MNILLKCCLYYNTDINTDVSTAILYNQSQNEYYIKQVDKYFDYLQNYTSNHFNINKPKYSQNILRYEWPPWGLLTGYKRDATLSVDYGIRLVDMCIVIDRKYRIQNTNPFVSSLVTFYYGENVTSRKHGIKIYEEFTFNSFNEITFIEAWSDDTIENVRDENGFPIFINDRNVWPSQIKSTSGSGIRISDIIPGLGCISSHGKPLLHDNSVIDELVKSNSDVKKLVDMSRDFIVADIVQELKNIHNSPASIILD